MANYSQNSISLLDDVDLFSSAADDNFRTNSISLSARSARSNSLIDAPIPNFDHEKLIDWNDFQTNPVQNADPTLGPLLDTNFVEPWPELPSVNVEYRVRGSSGSISSQKDQNLLELLSNNGPVSSISKKNGIFFNHTGLDATSFSTNKDLYRSDSAPEQCRNTNNISSKFSNATGLAIPPKIEQRKSVLGSAPPMILANGYVSSASNDSNVKYQRFSSKSGSADSDLIHDTRPSSTAFNNSIKSENLLEDDADDDEVFLHMGSAGERASVLAPLTGGRKKKVRFFEDGQMESELLVGSVPPSISSANSVSAAVSLRKGRSCRRRLICWSLIAAITLALMATIISIIYAPWRKSANSKRLASGNVILSDTCSNIDVDYAGNISLDNIYPTSAITTLCMKERECKDTVVFGFGSTVAVPCYVNSNCRGGVIAVGISSGDVSWRRSLLGEVNGINCQDDLNGDGMKDCMASGKYGVLTALDGKTGEPVWESGNGDPNAEFLMPQMIADMDNDGVPEILSTMVNRVEDYIRLYLFSGKTGKPFIKHTSYMLHLSRMDTNIPAMIWKHGESPSDIVISAGSFFRRGGVYAYTIQAVLAMRLEKGRLLYNDSVLTPPVFADVNADSFGDMILCTVSGELIAFDGSFTKSILWRFKLQNAECASPIITGLFNDDSIPDFAASFCFGYFPTYRYCETYFVDGRNGQEVNQEKRIRSLLPSIASGLSIHNGGNVGDVFLLWKASCGGTEQSLSYRFMDAMPTSWDNFGWSNICGQLFGKMINQRLVAISSSMEKPSVIFDYGDRPFNDELEKFVSLLEQVEPSFSYSDSRRRKVASVRLGPSGIFITNKIDGQFVVDLYIPTFVSVASPIGVEPIECPEMNENSGICGKQMAFIGRQANPRYVGVDFSGGLLLHKIRLRCSCAHGSNSKCAGFISDSTSQPWSEYLGSKSNGRY